MNPKALLTYWIFNWPVWKSERIAKVFEVINIAEQLIFQLWIVDNWDRAVLVECSCIALKTRGEVSKMSSNLLYHETPGSYKVGFNTCQAVLSDHTTCSRISSEKIFLSSFPHFRKGFRTGSHPILLESYFNAMKISLLKTTWSDIFSSLTLLHFERP